MGIRLSVLHFNHQLRGAESDSDEAFAAGLAAECGLPFFAGRGDVAAAVREQGWNLEDAARRLRYGFFTSALSDGWVTRVAVAHTADDQAETVMARLVRGTGPAGLAAIYPVMRLDGHDERPRRRRAIGAPAAGGASGGIAPVSPESRAELARRRL